MCAGDASRLVTDLVLAIQITRSGGITKFPAEAIGPSGPDTEDKLDHLSRASCEYAGCKTLPQILDCHPLATTEIGAELIFRHDSKSSLNSIAMSRIRVSEWTDAQTNELVVVSPVLE